jgi:hypothetical protein
MKTDLEANFQLTAQQQQFLQRIKTTIYLFVYMTILTNFSGSLPITPKNM